MCCLFKQNSTKTQLINNSVKVEWLFFITTTSVFHLPDWVWNQEKYGVEQVESNLTVWIFYDQTPYQTSCIFVSRNTDHQVQKAKFYDNNQISGEMYSKCVIYTIAAVMQWLTTYWGLINSWRVWRSGIEWRQRCVNNQHIISVLSTYQTHLWC